MGVLAVSKGQILKGWRDDMYWFIADEHFGHFNIITYTHRPFTTVEEMDEEIIKRFNSVVRAEDTTIHAGDFTLANKEIAYKYEQQLNGSHIFLRGSHDRWMKGTNHHEILDITIEKQPIVICHYAMRVWHRSHYNSWNIHGHSHGKLPPIGKQIDVGVDTNSFYPYSFEMIKDIMKDRPNNPNFLGDRRK